jgi:hypothetical protein
MTSIFPISKRYESSLTKQCYTLTVNVEKHFDHDTEVNIPQFCEITGAINNQIIMRESPVTNDFKSKHNSSIFMFRSLENFLEGKSHYTHYENFPEIKNKLDQMKG